MRVIVEFVIDNDMEELDFESILEDMADAYETTGHIKSVSIISFNDDVDITEDE